MIVRADTTSSRARTRVPPGARQPVVVDTHIPSGVAGLRALGKAGLAPIAVGSGHADAGLWSRYSSRRTVVEKTSPVPRRLGDALDRLAASTGPVVPYPGMEPTIDAILAAARRNGDVVAPFPADPVDALRWKGNMTRHAQAASIAVPPTVTSTVAELATARLRFPCAVKSDAPTGLLSRTWIFETAEPLRRALSTLPPDERLVVQPRLQGPMICLGLVIDREGGVVSRFQHLATRTWPADAGSTARGVSVPADEDLVVAGGRFLVELGYWGLAELDFLHGPDGPALVDVNPRFYPALALATACGANLPAAWHAVVLGDPVPPAAPYRTGVTYRWLEADILAALRWASERPREPTGPRSTGPMWDAEDPVPGVLLAMRALLSRVARVARRAAHAREPHPSARSAERSKWRSL